jgi:23S rRNA (guanine2445-N2)-methyltransferase / 23S rRNA (guanine2069-N7)-methyltransferase
LLRDYYGFLGWLGHDAASWAALQAEAQARRAAGAERIPPIVGYDADRRAVRAAIANVTRAGLLGKVHIERQDLSAAPPIGHAAGLLVANPPYGERLGQDEPLPKLYATLGTVLKERFGGWRAVVFTGNPDLTHRLRMKAVRSFELYNGALPCKGFEYHLPHTVPATPLLRPLAPSEQDTVAAGAQMFANRLHKDLRTIGRWARRSGVDCYRLYDADLPEFALAIDLYRGEQLWAHVQEYRAPATVDPQKAEARWQAALRVIPEVLAIESAQMFCKRRERQRGRAQYEKLGATGAFHVVTEGPYRYRVNFTDYLDTGLFLDHRGTRVRLREWAGGKRFLNLFAYTGTATVAAALGGALSTTTVDLSHTYLEWAQRNLALNTAADQRHQFIQADCREWLIETARTPQRYDLIFLDPPTFSNSKRMDGSFDVQRDHVELIRRAVQLLARDGVLIFSTNRQRFRLDTEHLAHLSIEDLTAATIPPDFARHPTIHQCWRLTRT